MVYFFCHSIEPGVVDETLDLLVVVGVLGAEVVGQLKKELTAQHLVAVHVRDVFELRLHWKVKVRHNFAVTLYNRILGDQIWLL